jgi:hypothetical protein
MDRHGLVPAGTGWFVLNARDARWFDKPGQGHSTPLTGYDEYEAETYFPMLGMAIRVLGPGEPSTTYHWETEQEDSLVLSGDGELAYARFPPQQPTRYREGLLPD